MRHIFLIRAVLMACSPVLAQSSSIGKTQATDSPKSPAQTATTPKGRPTLDKHSLIAVKAKEPKKFAVNEFLTIIVREQVLYEADGTANTRRQSTLNSELDAFIKFTGGGIGEALFRRGKPNINYRGTFNQRNDAESEREDRLTTRLTARIIDVKPNGNLIFEATRQIRHDDETNTMKLTGGCRSIDVSPDNSVLSTQVADLHIAITTKGSVRNATRSGWLGTFYDWIRPL